MLGMNLSRAGRDGATVTVLRPKLTIRCRKSYIFKGPTGELIELTVIACTWKRWARVAEAWGWDLSQWRTIDLGPFVVAVRIMF